MGLERRIGDTAKSRPGETILWVDRHKSLFVSRFSSEHGMTYSLRLADQVRVDVRNGVPCALETGKGVTGATIEHFLRDQVEPRLRSSRGEFVLHAASVFVGNAAFILMGESGRGKSTLGASFLVDGYSLLGDDAAIARNSTDGSTISAMYPSLRLFPDAIDHLFKSIPQAERTSQNSDKRNVRLPPAQAYSEETRFPLVAGFILSSKSNASIKIERMGMADACIGLVEHSFALDPSDPAHAQRTLSMAKHVAQGIPIFSLAYPRSFAMLPAVRMAVLAEIEDILEKKNRVTQQ